MSGCAALNWAILLLYIWPMSFRTSSILGMPSSPLPLDGVGLDMLSLSLGFALFHAAKADSKEYFSVVELKVMRARASKCLPAPLGSKISTLHCVFCFVCVWIISLILWTLSCGESSLKLVPSLSFWSISIIWCILTWASIALYLVSAWLDLMWPNSLASSDLIMEFIFRLLHDSV